MYFKSISLYIIYKEIMVLKFTMFTTDQQATGTSAGRSPPHIAHFQCAAEVQSQLNRVASQAAVLVWPSATGAAVPARFTITGIHSDGSLCHPQPPAELHSGVTETLCPRMTETEQRDDYSAVITKHVWLFTDDGWLTLPKVGRFLLRPPSTANLIVWTHFLSY